MLKNKIFFLSILLSSGLSTAVEVSADNTLNYEVLMQAIPPHARRGPSPAAQEACENKQPGDSCTFNNRRGQAIEGSCLTRNQQTFCMPKNRGKKRAAGKDRNQPQ
ncbi:MAG: hypothetical protein SVR94_18810 [Pseudomonadota bacterium]|nr:hypothetical protein [Pseudomonadota bacterium]